MQNLHFLIQRALPLNIFDEGLAWYINVLQRRLPLFRGAITLSSMGIGPQGNQ